MKWLARFLLALTLVAGLALSPAQATQIFVISGTSQTSPIDWCNSNNLIEAWGGGGSGAVIRGSSTVAAAGGGGSEYRAGANFAVATPGTTAFNYTIGPGGTAVSAAVNATTAGNIGTQTTFNTSTVIAKPGSGGPTPVSLAAGGAGGTGGTGAAAHSDGGRGGNETVASTASATGGGAAGSAAGVGGNGVDASTAIATAGGAGANAGATGGAATGAAGGDGTDNSTHSGGGGGGASKVSASNSGTGGTGGHYGGGGGAAVNTSGGGTQTSGAGQQGLIVLTYTACPGGGTSSYLPLLGVGSLEHPANDNFEVRRKAA